MLAKLFESEIGIMQKVQTLLRKFQAQGQLNLQITQLFQSTERNQHGSLCRKAIKSITKGQLTDAEVSCLVRRMDADGDNEISFNDFFTHLLPYFVHNDLTDPKPKPDKALKLPRSQSGNPVRRSKAPAQN